MIASNPTHVLRRAATALVAALLTLALAPLAPATAQVPAPSEEPEADTGDSRRLAGDGRFDTAAEIAEDAFPDGAEVAIVTRGDTFPDALAGSYLAGLHQGPILLTNTDSIPEGTSAALNDVSSKVFVLGGVAAVSETVVSQLRAEGLEVERISGVSRYDTARRVATAGEVAAGELRDMSQPQAPDGSPFENPQTAPTAFLATGDSFADALAAGPLAYFGGHPIILTRSDTLSEEAKAAIQDETLAIEQVVIIGGRRAVATSIEAQVEALGRTVHRVSGETRLATAAELARFYVRNQPSSVEPEHEPMAFAEVNVALSQNFPDALSLGPRGGETRSVILLSQTPEDLGDTTRAFIADRCDDVDTVVIAGGESVISAENQTAAEQASICGTVQNFTITPEAYTRIVGEEHEVTVTVRDSEGNGVSGVFIHADVYREDSSTPLEEAGPTDPPAQMVEGTTGADGSVTLSYAYEPNAVDPRDPPPEVNDLIVACVHPSDRVDVPCEWAEEQDENLLKAQARARWFQDGVRVEVSGAEVVPGPGAEDATGVVVLGYTVIVNETTMNASSQLCFMVDIDGLEEKATDVHIHSGAEGETGDVVATLRPAPDADGFSQSCANSSDFARGQSVDSWVEEMQTTPEDFYIDVHNPAFPDGALRGQLE